MSNNFLPDFNLPITQGEFTCLVRNKRVKATPEEQVRQRVLNWLIHDKGWNKEHLRLENSYAWLSDPDRTHVRPDIEILEDGKVLVVVECKRKSVPVGEHVYQQAREYADKANANWIWTTNGENHVFFENHNSEWTSADRLEPLEVTRPPVRDPVFPKNANHSRSVARYFREFGDDKFIDEDVDFDRGLVLAVHRMLFSGVYNKLPYSHGGVHILEDRGASWHKFANPGGSYRTRYADFIAATSGRVEAVSVGINRWGDSESLRICVGVRKPNRSHHALQLDTDQCEYDEERGYWHIYHDGSMASVARKDVLEAIREAGAGRWVDSYDDGKRWIYLGELPDINMPTNVSSTRSRKLLANLIHYAIIRTNLRDANYQRNQKKG